MKLILAGVAILLVGFASTLTLPEAAGQADAKKAEAKKPAGNKEPWPINDSVEDPAVWGKAFPEHYAAYRKTTDMTRSKYGGSEAMPRTPTKADPRSIVARSKVEEDEGLKAMWQGYAFATDFREERGHAYMLEDQKLTQRQVVAKQPGACVNCHGSMYLAYKKAGNGDINAGFAKINAMPYQEAEKLVSHPVACIDCHDGKNMRIRVTRPAFIEGMRAFKASQGVNNYDVNRDATANEMRAYVCGQCHVEYYFRGTEKRLVYPWAKGLKVENIMAYYDEAGFRDWTHKDTGAPALKAQHPEFETWNQGSHARAGVTCSDCHMPKSTQGRLHPDLDQRAAEASRTTSASARRPGSRTPPKIRSYLRARSARFARSTGSARRRIFERAHRRVDMPGTIISSIASASLVQALLHHVRRAQHRARLVLRLLPLGLGHRIVDDAGAGLRVEHAVLDHRGADRDRGVHVVLEAHVADRARVDAAARRLELVDDLHRAHLGRAAHRAGRETPRAARRCW